MKTFHVCSTFHLVAGSFFLAWALCPLASGQYSHVVIDPQVIPNGHKPKVIGDFANSGYASVGAEAAGQGFKLYKYPNWTPYLITTYGNGAGDEDAQVADVNGDGALDIVVGGLTGNTYWLENPLKQNKDPYTSTWKVHQIAFGLPSHDVVVGDINKDGKVDVATESGIYLQGATPDTWIFVGAPNINRSLEGTALANLIGDGYLDVIAPDQTGARLAWFENPLHHGGDPVKDVWTMHIIETNPGFSGNMTVAAADINQDGRIDVLLAPMYNDGLLVWYQAPPDPRNGTWTKHSIGPVHYVHQASLQILDFDGDGLPDIAFAEQEQSATKRIGIFFNGGGGVSWTLRVLATTGGHNPKAGVIGNDKYPSILCANHGYYGAPNPVELWRNTSVVIPPGGPASDEFNASALNFGLWTAVNPLGDAAFGDDGSDAVISLPAGTSHNLWTGGNAAAQLLQSSPNGDFTIEAKFDSVFTAGYQMQGVIVQQDVANYLRFENYYDGATSHIFAASLAANSPTVFLDAPVFTQVGGSFWIRVTRVGNTWTQSWSTDGVNFVTGVTFNYVLTVAQTGIYAGNFAISGLAPAFYARVDYFHYSAGGASPTALTPDDFNTPVLNTSLWTFVNPVGDGSYSLTGANLLLNVPAGRNHDPFYGGTDNAVRIMQNVASTSDFQVEVKFDSIPRAAYQMQGVLVEQDAANYLRFEVYSDGIQTYVYAAKVLSSNETMLANVPIATPGTSVWLRAQKAGNVWTQWWSSDGFTFNAAIAFTQALSPARVGIDVGNYSSLPSAAPAFTASVDYFH